VSKQYGGPFAWLRRWNHRRLEKRRWRRELLEALADDDVATMVALARLVEEVRADGAARTVAVDALSRQVEAVADGQAALAPMLARLGSSLGERLQALEQRVASAPDRFPNIPTSREWLVEPELSVLAHLAPSLSPRLALDVGANHGVYTLALQRLGFEVHALEPDPAARAELLRQVDGLAGVTVHACAAGAEVGEARLGLVADQTGFYGNASAFSSLSRLPLPEGLVPAGAVTVPVCRLDALVRERGLATPSVVKVDTEGYELEVLRGLGDLWPKILLAEFWDETFPLSGAGARNRLPDLVAHARAHGARFHLAIFRRWGDGRPAFFSGWNASPERSWGNLLFFTDRAMFESARQHLATLIPEARFVAAPGP
jgi:FkbM family methyltransferase